MILRCFMFACFCALALGSLEENTVWYFGALVANASLDPLVCGKTRDTPCADLSVVFGFQAECMMPTNFTAGSDSTTIVLLPGIHSMHPVCFSGWKNLSIIAEDGACIDGRLGPGSAQGLLSFENCVNIRLQGLDFHYIPIGRSGVYVRETTNVIVSACNFLLSAKASSGINLQFPSGIVVMMMCRFVGNVTDDDKPEVTGILVSWSTGLTVEQSNVSQCSLSGRIKSRLSIENCSFNGLIVKRVDTTSSNDFSSFKTSTFGSAIDMKFGATTCGQDVLLNSNHFEDIVAVGGSSLLILFESYSIDNTVYIFDNYFKNGRASYGGGIGIFHWSGTVNNSVFIQESTFVNNAGLVEGGGLFCVFLSKHSSGQLHIEGSHFSNNSASIGAAVYIANTPFFFESPQDLSELLRPPFVNVYVISSSFVNNHPVSPSSIGIVVVTHIEMYLTGNNTFLWNLESALVVVSSLLRISGHITFAGNHAPTGSCMFLLLGSRVDMRSVELANFVDNFATRGSILDADSTTSSETFPEYFHKRSTNPSTQTSCFILFNKNLNPTDEPTRFFFRNNSATFFGSLFSVNSLHFCDIGYFVPSNVTNLVSLFQSNNVVEYTDSPLQSGLSTAPSFIVFYGSSSQCYKTAGNITYLLPNCSHQLLKGIFLDHAYLQCALRNTLTSNFPFTPGYGLHPIVDHFIVPWAGIDRKWDDPVDSSVQACMEPNASNILLSPAPGEQFDITIQVLDQMLNLAGSTASLKVSGDTPGVLLQANGLQYGSTDILYFTPNRAITEIALGGLPGTKGVITITVKSRILFKYLTLNIPFQLANCPLGLLPPIATSFKVEELVKAGFVTQRLPTPNLLACRCISEVYDGFGKNSIECVRGYTAYLSHILWMGTLVDDATRKSNEQLQTVCPASKALPNDLPYDSVTNWVRWNAEFRIKQQREGIHYPLLATETLLAPVDVAPYEGHIVPGGGAQVNCFKTVDRSSIVNSQMNYQSVIYPCPAGYCQVNPTGIWIASDHNFPCVENRQGVLCGQCKEGFAVSPLTTVCRDCKGSNPAPVVVLYLLGGFLVVVVSVLLNIGAIPAFDTLLFFFQSTLVLLSSRPGFQSFSTLAIFSNLEFSFDLCFTPNMNALDKSVWGYFSPAYILFLVGILIVLSRVKNVSKYLGKHSYLQALWLLLLLSYVNLLLSSFSILHCVSIGEENLARYVLVDDGSINCYQGGHLAAAIISILLLVIVVLPFPIYLTALLYFPRWKPFTDVYSRVYKDDRQWWVFFVLFKRIIVVVLGVFVKNFLLRQYSLTFWFLLVSMAYGCFIPYPKQVDNGIELFALMILIIMSMLSIGTITQNGVSTNVAVIVSWLLVVLVTLVCGIQIITYLWKKIRDFIERKTKKKIPRLNFLKKIKNLRFCLKKQTIEDVSVNEMNTGIQTRDEGLTDYSVYREPLLNDDDFVAENESYPQLQKTQTDIPQRFHKKNQPLSSVTVDSNLSNSESVWSASDEY